MNYYEDTKKIEVSKFCCGHDFRVNSKLTFSMLKAGEESATMMAREMVKSDLSGLEGHYNVSKNNYKTIVSKLRERSK